MSKEMIYEKLGELGKNPDFEAAINEADTKEAAIKVLEEFGWKISMDEFERDVLPALRETISDNGELTEENLENVAGGGIILSIVGVCACVWMAKGFFNALGCE